MQYISFPDLCPPVVEELPASLSSLGEEATVLAQEAWHERQMLLLRSHQGPPPLGQLPEGLLEQFEGETEEDEEEEDAEGNDDDARSDDFMQEGDDA